MPTNTFFLIISEGLQTPLTPFHGYAWTPKLERPDFTLISLEAEGHSGQATYKNSHSGSRQNRAGAWPPDFWERKNPSRGPKPQQGHVTGSEAEVACDSNLVQQPHGLGVCLTCDELASVDMPSLHVPAVRLRPDFLPSAKSR